MTASILDSVAGTGINSQSVKRLRRNLSYSTASTASTATRATRATRASKANAVAVRLIPDGGEFQVPFAGTFIVRVLIASVFLFANVASVALAGAATSARSSGPTVPRKQSGQLETYRDLIMKAQNLTLQRDRLQTSQVLLRALRREIKGGTPYKELARTLDDLSSVFYTEKAQMLHAAGESLPPEKNKEALERFQQALRIEEGNVAVLKSLSRAHLVAGECDRAETYQKAAEALNPISPEVKLLRLQVWDCQKNTERLSEALKVKDADMAPVESAMKGLLVGEFLRSKDFKKARVFLGAWETQAPENPEVHYWKWELARAMGMSDQASALKYIRLCQSLSPRRRRVYALDVHLCRGKEAVEAFLQSPAIEEET